MMRDCCDKCPMYWSSRDYWGECDEGCVCGLDGWFNGKNYKPICYMPIFIKKLYLKYVDWKDDRYWKKHIMDYEEDEDGDVIDKLN